MYEIAEHSAERLIVRRYWDGRGEGRHMFFQGIVFIVVGTFFPYHILTAPDPRPPWLALAFGSGLLLGPFFIWLSYRQRKRIEEGLYIFDKSRGVFELCHRNERGTTKSESYPLDLVRGAVAEDIGTAGYARRLVIVLRDNRIAALYNWTTFIHGNAERASDAINAFLGLNLPSN
jgi:hypothetical protein